MAYYIRLITKSLAHVTVHRLSATLSEWGVPGLFGIASGSESEWTQLLVRNMRSEDVCSVERNQRGSDSLFDEEVTEFRDELAACLPRRGADWVTGYLDEAQVIYALRVNTSRSRHEGSEPELEAHSVLWALKRDLGGIVQADLEGFTNEEGYTVVWQFGDGVDGEWAIAVLGDDGIWKAARIDLGSEEHRAAFMSGRIPEGVPEI
jgi:hypothetical protein